jgi:large subunit GTPase 1
LITLLTKLKPEAKKDQRLNVGFVGYPNVGKSSTINKLMGEKKVWVFPQHTCALFALHR